MRKTVQIAAMLALWGGAGQADAGLMEQLRALGTSPADTSSADKAPRIEIEGGGAVLSPGDRVAFRLSGVQGAQIYVLNMDSAGAVQLIYPNRFTPDPGPQEGPDLRLPPNGAAYVLEVSGGPGAELIKLFVVETGAERFDALVAGLFDRSAAFAPAIGSGEAVVASLERFLASGQARIRTASVGYLVEP